MKSLSSRIEKLEREHQFRQWFAFERFLEGLTEPQLKDIAIYGRFPSPLPEPLPKRASRLDSLDRKKLLSLWEESEQTTWRLVGEMEGRSKDELRYHLEHEHWPEQPCDEQNCLVGKFHELGLQREIAREINH